MYMLDGLAKKIELAILGVIGFLILLLVLKSLEVSKLKSQNETLQAKYKLLETSLKNPGVIKEPSIQVKTITRTINLTEEEKKEISENYRIEIEDLQRLLEAVGSQKTVTITREGKKIYSPVIPSEESQEIKAKRGTILGSIFADSTFSLGLAYELFPKWNSSLGVSVNNSGVAGASFLYRF